MPLFLNVWYLVCLIDVADLFCKKIGQCCLFFLHAALFVFCYVIDY